MKSVTRDEVELDEITILLCVGRLSYRILLIPIWGKKRRANDHFGNQYEAKSRGDAPMTKCDALSCS